MKILITADWGLHTWKSYGYDAETGLPRRLREQQKVLEQIQSIIVSKQIGHMIHGGDLYHKVGEIPVECLNVADNFFESLPIPWSIAEGNHDMVDRESPKWFQSAVRIFGKAHKDIGKVKLVGWGDFVDYDELKGYDLLVLHKQPTLTNRYGHRFQGVNWKKLAQNNGLVFFGHYHERMALSDNCFTIGPPMITQFGEFGTRGVWIVDTDGWKVEFVKLEYPEFLTVENSDDVKDDGNYYKVLNARKRIDKTNVVSIVTPKRFEERLKSEKFEEILKEWAILNDKGQDYLDVIQNLVSTKVQLAKTFFKGRLVEVTIKDFMSIAEATFGADVGTTLLVGQGGSFGDSNGAGKTNFFEAICWCLFGETTKGLTGNDVLPNNRQCKDCLVVAQLIDLEGDAIEISRSRKKGLSVKVNGEERVAGLLQANRQQVLEEEILGFNKRVFSASCYFSQESLLVLSGLSDTDKTNMITDLLGFEAYDDLYHNTGEAIKSFSESIEDSEREQAKAESSIQVEEAHIGGCDKSIVTVVEQLRDERKKIDLLKQRVSEIEVELVQLENKSVGKQSSHKDYEATLSDLRDMSEKVGTKVQKIDETAQRCNRDITKVREKIGGLVAHREEVLRRQHELRLEIKDLSSLKFGERCDKCGAEITIDNVETFIKEKSDKIVNEEENVAKADSAIAEHKQSVESLDKELRELTESRTSLLTKRDKIQNDIEETLSEKSKAEAEAAKFASEKEQFQNQVLREKALIAECERSIDLATAKQTSIERERESHCEAITKFKKELKAIDAEIASRQSAIEKLEFWKVAFSSKGIRAVLLDRFCNEFNRIVNEYAAIISGGSMGIVVSPTKVTKSGEEKNKVGINVMLNNRACDYKSLSGGEKRRVDVSLCLSLNTWVSERYAMRSGLLGLLILDEVFSFVDKVGEEAIAELLRNEALYKAVFVVSHTSELSSYVDNVWQVVRENGISNLYKEGRSAKSGGSVE